MSSSIEARSTSSPDFVDLSNQEIRTPPGWSNNRDDLNIDMYFTRGSCIPTLFEELGYRNVLPVITNLKDTYIVQAQPVGQREQRLFVWNVISGRLMMVQQERMLLKEVMNKVGLSILSLDMTLLATT